MASGNKSKARNKRVENSEDQFGLGNRTDIALMKGEKVAFTTRLSTWGFMFALLALVLFVIIMLTINYVYLFITPEVFTDGFIYTQEKVFAIVFASGFILIFAYFVHKFLRYRRFDLVITNKRIIVKDEFITNTDISKVTGALVDQNPLGTAFNYGDLVVSSSSGRVQTFLNIPNPHKAQKAINKIVENIKSEVRPSIRVRVLTKGREVADRYIDELEGKRSPRKDKEERLRRERDARRRRRR